MCRWGMYAPGVVGIAVGVLILLIMKDSPESIGYPPIEPKKTHACESASQIIPMRMPLWPALLSLLTCFCVSPAQNAQVWVRFCAFYLLLKLLTSAGVKTQRQGKGDL